MNVAGNSSASDTAPKKLLKVENKSKTKSMIKNIAITILAAAAILAFSYALNAGMEKQDRVTCQRLQRQAIDYAPIFYATDAENKMCDALGMPIK